MPDNTFLIFLPLLILIGFAGIIYCSQRYLALVRFFAIFSITLLAIYKAISEMTGAGMNDAALFHMGIGQDGADLWSFKDIYISTLLYWAFWTCIILLIQHIQRLQKKASSESPPNILQPTITTISWITLLASIAANPIWQDIWRQQLSEADSDIAALVSTPQNHASAGKSFVYIYLESLERSLIDPERFPGLTPFISQQAKQALDFSNVGQTFGASWTIAGMVASQCGIPLVKPGKYIGTQNLDYFLPDAVCTGDILSKAGYQLHYMGGASLSFGAKGSLYKSHGFHSIEGLNELKAETNTMKSGWGIYDQDLFNLAANRYFHLANQQQPFGLYMLTLDTHPPFSLSPTCQKNTYRDGKNSFLNAVHCTDQLLQQFLEKISTHAAFKDTIIVIASDHLGQTTGNIANYDKKGRSNLFLILNSGHLAKKIDTPALTQDAGPTLFSAIEIPITELGIGKSLLSSTPLIRGPLPLLEKKIYQGRNHFFTYWGLPSFNNGFSIDIKRKEVMVDRKAYDIPSIMTLSKDLRLQSIYNDRDLLLATLQNMAKLGVGERFVWIDHCHNQRMAGFGSPAENEKSEWCLLIGRHGSNDLQRLTLTQNPTKISPETLESAYNGWPDFFGYLLHYRSLKSLERYGALEVKNSKILRAPESIVLTSSGLNHLISKIYRDNSGLLMAIFHEIVIFGGNKHKNPVALARIDCKDKNSPRLSDIIQNKSEIYEYFFIVSSPTSCETSTLERIFQGTPFRHWKAIAAEKPYIATLNTNSEKEEFVGNRNESIAVRIP